MVTDWKSASEMAHDLLAAKYLCLICLGAIVIDFAHSLRFDYDLLTKKKKDRRGGNKIRWPQICYFACKLFYFPYWTVTLITGEPMIQINCQATITMSEVLMGIITCLCSALLGFRTLCIWQHRCGKVFKGFMFILWLGLLAVWMIGVPDVKGRWMIGIGSPWVEDQGACWFDPIPFRYAAKFVATVAFDTLILLLTVIGVKEARINTRLGAILVEQGTIYVVLTLIVNVMLVSFAWSNLNDIMTVVLSVPAQTISVMAATHLYVLLYQETTKRHKPYKTGSSLPSFSSPSKLAGSGLSSSFPTYVINGTNLVDTVEKLRDPVLDLNPPSIDNSSVSRAASSCVMEDDGIPLKLKKSTSIMKLIYDERDPFARRPNTSPTSMKQFNKRKHGPSVFIHETCSVVSEPIPAHLQGSPFLSSHLSYQNKQQRPYTAAHCSNY